MVTVIEMFESPDLTPSEFFFLEGGIVRSILDGLMHRVSA